MTNSFKQALVNKEFVVTCEMIPGRGAHEAAQAREFENAQAIYATGLVHAISITENPGGNPALLADEAAVELHRAGITPVVHFTCKDKNRNQMQSQLYALERNGIQNVLVMSGDYQSSGFQGKARPVFDLDPVQTLGLISGMNEGLVVKGPRGDSQEKPSHFFAGAVVSPFKYTEGELIPQYLKLEKKILAGANYIISQLGFDVRKMQELVMYVRERGYHTPLIANIFLISRGTARFMRQGGIPGCTVNDELMHLLENEAQADDKGAAARIERAAKMVAIAMGLGYSGVHIGGFGLTAETVRSVLNRAMQLVERWPELAREISYGVADGYYLYEPEYDAQGAPSGLNTPAHAYRSEKASGKRVFKRYGLSRFFHKWVLTPDERFYKRLAKSMDRRERKHGINRRHGFEHLGKTALYGCEDCGDCGLEACVYSCPMAQCPKCQRNGPCGGSFEGWCEVYPDERYCIHYMAYHRLKKYDELQKMTSFITPPNDWTFKETSAWSNYTHRRDNAAHRIAVSLGLPDLQGSAKAKAPAKNSGSSPHENKEQE